ncbi:PREDICTED: uncharacterized protein LOC104735262 [Camelina sativa]|uniref:Uncharacterized protein LOC104735262 n=1 Tax=Camelina sativa TaxID=90675 RepID=A0ABM0VAF6_CAMSA|nr:PREDICTED: uncharacterized protein LOC104735262 [Camelina sativa]
MLLRQLKQFTLSAARRNGVFGTDVKQLTRFYGSPAVCESLTTTTSKVYKRLSKEDRRVLVESYVNEYRASNAGKFPTLSATLKAVGGSRYILRVILQELKLRPKADVPIVAKALSEVSVSPSVPDGSSSHFSPVVVEPELQAGGLDIEIGSEQRQDIIDSSLSGSDGESNVQGNNNITATDDKRETETSQRIEVEVSLKNSETEEEGNVMHLGNQESISDHLEGAAVSADDESNLQGNNNLVITATEDTKETETSQRMEVGVCLKNSETEEEGNLSHLGNQESKADHLEGAVTADVVPTESRQVSETGADEVKETGAHEVKETGAGEVKEERSSAWSNLLSFAKDFASIWRR